MILSPQTDAIRELMKNYPQVVGIYLYGSHARNTENQLSDIDLGIMVDGGAAAAAEFQLEMIGRMMEIFGTDNVDVQMLTEDSPPALALAMLKGRVIYCRSHSVKAAKEARILSLYQDFQPFIDLYAKHVIRRLEEGAYAAG